MKKYLAIGIILGIASSCDFYDDEYLPEPSPFPENVNWVAVADSSSQSFVETYWNATDWFFYDDNLKTIGTYDYWPEAHGLDVLVDAYERTQDALYGDRIYEFYTGVKRKNYAGDTWWNNYYDDMGWHGLAHMRAWKATNDARYEESSRELWEWITEGWTEYDGGGIAWNHEDNEDGRGKGIPSNGPAAIIAARRWKEYGDTEIVRGYNNLEWLERIYDWMKTNRTVPETGRVFEKLNETNNDQSYNAGTFIGAALEFYSITKRPTYLNDAIKTADYFIANRINKNTRVMEDFGQQLNHDCNLFKGIFIRYFTQLIMHPELPEVNRKRYINFIVNNANQAWFNGTQKDPTILYSWDWCTIPVETMGYASLRAQLSGCMLMEAIALLQKEGYPNE